MLVGIWNRVIISEL